MAKKREKKQQNCKLSTMLIWVRERASKKTNRTINQHQNFDNKTVKLISSHNRKRYVYINTISMMSSFLFSIVSLNCILCAPFNS